jgi:hypothetical protein
LVVRAVWQKLEEQNPAFFQAYYVRLKVKEQITLFNHLLDQHVHLMHKLRNYSGPPHKQPHALPPPPHSELTTRPATTDARNWKYWMGDACCCVCVSSEVRDILHPSGCCIEGRQLEEAALKDVSLLERK